MEDGERISARAVVIATEGPAAAELLGMNGPRSHSVTCIYFDAPQDPVGEPILVLNGQARGQSIISVPNQVCSSYAPAGSSLVSATVLGDTDVGVEITVRQQLREWYGNSVEDWRLLHRFSIEHALPVQDHFCLLINLPKSRKVFMYAVTIGIRLPCRVRCFQVAVWQKRLLKIGK